MLRREWLVIVLASLSITFAFVFLSPKVSRAAQLDLDSKCSKVARELPRDYDLHTSKSECPKWFLAIAALASPSFDGNSQMVERLLKIAGEDGNKNSKIFYTLIFTNLYDSPFFDQLTRDSSYSPFTNYLGAVKIVRNGSSLNDCGLGVSLFNSALVQGVKEALVGLAFCNYVSWRVNGDKFSQDDYVVSLLQVAQLVSLVEEAKSAIRVNIPNIDEPTLQHLMQLAMKKNAASEVSFCSSQNTELKSICLFSMDLVNLACSARNDNGELMHEWQFKDCRQILSRIVPLYIQRIRKRVLDLP